MTKLDISFYSGVEGVNPQEEIRLEHERGKIVSQMIEPWKNATADKLSSGAELVTSIHGALIDARTEHNERYVKALALEFNQATKDLKLQPVVREALDKLLNDTIAEHTIPSADEEESNES